MPRLQGFVPDCRSPWEGDRPRFRGGSDCVRNHLLAGGSSDSSTAPRRAGSQQLSARSGGSQARPSLAGHTTFAAFLQAVPTSDGVVVQPWCRAAQRAVRAGQAATALPPRKRFYSVPLATAALGPLDANIFAAGERQEHRGASQGGPCQIWSLLPQCSLPRLGGNLQLDWST